MNSGVVGTEQSASWIWGASGRGLRMGLPPLQATMAAPVTLFLGTGGRGCSVDTRSDSFSATDRIRLVGDALPGAEAVTIAVFSVPLLQSVAGYPAVRWFGPTARCATDDLPPLAVGRYEASIVFGYPASRDGLITFEVVAAR